MKVKCNRLQLYDAFQVALIVVPQKSTVPALVNVKLTATKDEKVGAYIELVGTDLEIGTRYIVPVNELIEEGTLVLPANRVGGILRETSDDEITIESDGYLANIKCSDSTYKIVGMDPSDYPEFPKFDKANVITIDREGLSDMIKKTQFATSTEVIRYALTGLLLEIRDGKELRIVASDGKRLAFIKKKLSGKESGKSHKDIKVLVPPKAMNLLDRVLVEDDEIVSLNVEESQIKLKTQKAEIFSRLIEGSFPDYEAVIPTDRDKKAVLSTENFYSAVRRAMIVTSEKNRAVKLSFSPKGKLTLFTRTQDVGEAKIEIDVDYKGEDFDIAFNPEYLIDYLKVVNEETVELHLKTKDSAGMFKAGRDYIYVIMPLTVQM